MSERVQRIAAFTTTPEGGNPAGVWVGDVLPSEDRMQAIAAEVGYSETIFAVPSTGSTRTVRYYSPLAEVPFCGHATIALGVALGDGEGQQIYNLETQVGSVALEVDTVDGRVVAALTSVEPSHRPAPADLLEDALDTLGWRPEELDPQIPPTVAFAGAHHLVIAVAERGTLSRLDYDFDRLQRTMLDHDLTTLQLIWREDATTFHARDPFPVGGVVEDPATGAAAAALGGYLRDSGLISVPTDLVIHQGVDMGRPSRLEVTIPARGGIVVRGAGVAIPQ